MLNVFYTISVEMKVDFKNLPKTFLKIHEFFNKNFFLQLSIMLTKEEKIWIIQHYTQSPHRTQLRRDFIQHFNITNEKKVPNTTAIKRII